MKRRFFLAALAALCLGGSALAEDATEGLTPQQILIQARAMFPKENFKVTGELITAKARGLEETARPYRLELNWAGAEPVAKCVLMFSEENRVELLKAEMRRVGGKPSLALIQDDGTRVENVNLNTPIGESDLTWVDLTFDYLWWTKVRMLDEAELEAKDIPTRRSSRDCVVLEAEPPTPVQGLTAVRLWVDKGTGLLLQTEQLGPGGKTARQMYVQRLGREQERWVPREFRVRRLGFDRVTKLTVETVRSDAFSTEANTDE